MQACLCMCVHANTKLWVLISIPGNKEKFRQRGFPWAKGTKQKSFKSLLRWGCFSAFKARCGAQGRKASYMDIVYPALG